MTNYERIKSMTVEEMADFLDKIVAECVERDCSRCRLGIIGHCNAEAIRGVLMKEEYNGQVFDNHYNRPGGNADH